MRQRLLVTHQGMLQRAEVQADFVRAEAQQGIDHGKAHTLIFIVEHGAKHQAALGPGQHRLNTGDSGAAHQRVVMLHVAAGQLQRQWRGVVG
ncbi:hypothetical protein D3C80_1916290 [compost metagenome]